MARGSSYRPPGPRRSGTGDPEQWGRGCARQRQHLPQPINALHCQAGAGHRSHWRKGSFLSQPLMEGAGQEAGAAQRYLAIQAGGSSPCPHLPLCTLPDSTGGRVSLARPPSLTPGGQPGPPASRAIPHLTPICQNMGVSKWIRSLWECTP